MPSLIRISEHGLNGTKPPLILKLTNQDIDSGTLNLPPKTDCSITEGELGIKILVLPLLRAVSAFKSGVSRTQQ